MASSFCGQIASAWSGAGERSGARPQLVLAFEAAALLDRFEMEAFVSAINSSTRVARLFGAIATRWFPPDLAQAGMSERTRAPAEFLFHCRVPVEGPHLVDVVPA